MIFNLDKLNPFIDSRGVFLKLMESGSYPKNYETTDKCFRPVQTFLSVTKKNSIRGMHFYKHTNTKENQFLHSSKKMFSSEIERFSKSFVVISGEIFFAAIDLRIDSEHFGKIETLNLPTYAQVSLPKMVATGFQVISDQAHILYFLDSVHKSEEDISINPISCGINWPLSIGSVSERDLNAMTLEEYLGESN